MTKNDRQFSLLFLPLVLFADGGSFPEYLPAAVSEARWNETGPYCGNMYKYAPQLGFDAKYVENLMRVNRFQVIFAPLWLRASNSADAQVNELQFRKDLEKFLLVDREMALKVIETWERHQCFLRPEFSILSLASDKVTSEEKKEIARSIQQIEAPAEFPPPQPKQSARKPAVTVCGGTELHQLATDPHVYLPFHLLKIDPTEFLTKDPAEWASVASFRKLQSFVRCFKVTNDCAENSVQLATMYNDKITKNDQQKTYLYATVMKERRERNDLRRKVLQPKNE